MKRLPRIISILLLTVSPLVGLHAQDEETVKELIQEQQGFFQQSFEVMMPVLILAFFLLIVLVLLLALTIDVGRQHRKYLMNAGKPVPRVIKLFGIFDGDWRAMTGENKDEIHDEEHDYDGIQEYDNDLPPWWVAGFYVTIIFAVVYMFAFHVVDWGLSPEEEYEKAMAIAEVKYANVDLVYEGPTDDLAALAEAKEIFVNNCKTCHAESGASSKGFAGPNLTDEYWLHGGDINDLYKSIKFGYADKGMPDWKSRFSNDQIYHLASFVYSLDYVSEEEGGKEPQGEKYIPENE